MSSLEDVCFFVSFEHAPFSLRSTTPFLFRLFGMYGLTLLDDQRVTQRRIERLERVENAVHVRERIGVFTRLKLAERVFRYSSVFPDASTPA